jgi:hypothetical protein
LPILHLTEIVLNLRHHGKSAYQNTAHLALEMYQIKALQIYFHLWHPFSHTLYHTPSTVFLIRPCGLRVQVESNEAFPIPKKELWLDLDSQSGVFLKQIDGNGS